MKAAVVYFKPYALIKAGFMVVLQNARCKYSSTLSKEKKKVGKRNRKGE